MLSELVKFCEQLKTVIVESLQAGLKTTEGVLNTISKTIYVDDLQYYPPIQVEEKTRTVLELPLAPLQSRKNKVYKYNLPYL